MNCSCTGCEEMPKLHKLYMSILDCEIRWIVKPLQKMAATIHVHAVEVDARPFSFAIALVDLTVNIGKATHENKKQNKVEVTCY